MVMFIAHLFASSGGTDDFKQQQFWPISQPMYGCGSAQGAFQLRTSCARDQVLTVTAAGFRAETYTLKLRLKERRNNMKRDFYLKSNRPAVPAPAPAPAARPFNPRPAPDEWTICPTCRKPKHMKPVAAPAPPSVACPGCGKQIDQDSKFCKECGTPQ